MPSTNAIKTPGMINLNKTNFIIQPTGRLLYSFTAAWSSTNTKSKLFDQWVVQVVRKIENDLIIPQVLEYIRYLVTFHLNFISPNLHYSLQYLIHKSLFPNHVTRHRNQSNTHNPTTQKGELSIHFAPIWIGRLSDYHFLHIWIYLISTSAITKLWSPSMLRKPPESWLIKNCPLNSFTWRNTTVRRTSRRYVIGLHQLIKQPFEKIGKHEPFKEL